MVDQSVHTQVDIFHPLATVEWTKLALTVPNMIGCSTHCVCLNERIYVVANTSGHSATILLSFSLDFTDCVRLSLPVESKALTHYHSQLVLVGEQHSYDDPSNELWVSADGINWRQSLPPRRIKRRGVSVINTGSPECLVVVGGCLAHKSADVDAVEVLVNEEWFIVQHLPNSVKDPKCYVHNGTLIVVSRIDDDPAYCCHVESLLASCVPSQGGEKASQSCDTWKSFNKLDELCMSWSRFSSFLSFQQQLVAFTRYSIEMFCPFSQTWIKLGNLPEVEYGFYNGLTSMVLTTGDIAILVKAPQEFDITVYTASFKSKLRLRSVTNHVHVPNCGVIGRIYTASHTWL